MRRALLLAAAAAVAGLALLAVCCPGRLTPDPSWTPRQFAAALANARLVYEVHELPDGAVILRTGEEAGSWEELQQLATQRPFAFTARPGRLYVVRLPDAVNLPLAGGQRDIVQVGKLRVRGHPDETARVLALFR